VLYPEAQPKFLRRKVGDALDDPEEATLISRGQMVEDQFAYKKQAQSQVPQVLATTLFKPIEALQL